MARHRINKTQLYQWLGKLNMAYTKFKKLLLTVPSTPVSSTTVSSTPVSSTVVSSTQRFYFYLLLFAALLFNLDLPSFCMPLLKFLEYCTDII